MSKVSQTPAVVIYNGPSRLLWRDFPFPGVVIGCNFAYRDWPITDCVAIDRMTVAAIRGELENSEIKFNLWTKLSNLELPPGWQHRSSPGIDSGSMAVSLALDLSDLVIVIGADGVCGGDTSTAYEYRWHGENKKRTIHQRHRQTLVELTRNHPDRITVIWDQPIEGLDCRTVDWAKTEFGKYPIEEHNGQTRNLQETGQRVSTNIH